MKSPSNHDKALHHFGIHYFRDCFLVGLLIWYTLNIHVIILEDARGKSKLGSMPGGAKGFLDLFQGAHF